MKVRRSRQTTGRYLHLLAYGYPGSGKTKLAADAHKAGYPIVVVTGESGDLTLEMHGIDCPILTPESEEELRAIFEVPEQVVQTQIHPDFPGYVPQVWVFDNLRTIQQVIFGEGPRLKTSVFGGAVELPKRDAKGILSIAQKRSSPNVPANIDYRELDSRMRRIVRLIESMNYHTIVTCHATIDYKKSTHKQLTGDPKIDKELEKELQGVPLLDGWSLADDIGGLVGDFFLYLKTPNGNNYQMCPKATGGYFARTRIAEHIRSPIDWTGKNGFQILLDELESARKKAAL